MLFRRAAVLLSALLACASASPLHRPSPPTISTDPSANPANLKIFEIFASSVGKVRREGGFVHGEVALARRDGPDDGGLPWTVVVKGGVASGERVAKVPLGLWITPRTVVDSELGKWGVGCGYGRWLPMLLLWFFYVGSRIIVLWGLKCGLSVCLWR